MTEKKEMFDVNHIDRSLSTEWEQELINLYALYHKQCYIYKASSVIVGGIGSLLLNFGSDFGNNSINSSQIVETHRFDFYHFFP